MCVFEIGREHEDTYRFMSIVYPNAGNFRMPIYNNSVRGNVKKGLQKYIFFFKKKK